MSFQDLLNSEMDFASLAGLARRGWRWWIDELAAMLPASWRAALSSRPRIFAERQASGGWLFWRDGQPLGDARPPRTAAVPIGLLLPSREVLVRRIDVPRMPAADVRRMLSLDIDRLSPLASDLIHFDSEVIDRDAPGGVQTVLLGIVPRTIADRLAREASAEGLSPASMGVHLPGDGARERFDFLPAVKKAAGEGPGRSARPYWWAAVAALLVLNIAILVGRDMADVASLQRRVDSQRPVADAAARLRRRLDGEETRRASLVFRGTASEPLRMLDALTEAVPKAAWVQRLEWNGKAVRIVGFKAADIDMAAAIRGSGYFTNPRSLTTEATPRTGNDQPFDITADAKPQARQ